MTRTIREDVSTFFGIFPNNHSVSLQLEGPWETLALCPIPIIVFNCGCWAKPHNTVLVRQRIKSRSLLFFGQKYD
jgi:hypothetical protein